MDLGASFSSQSAAVSTLAPATSVSEDHSTSSWRVLSGPREGSTDFEPGCQLLGDW